MKNNWRSQNFDFLGEKIWRKELALKNKKVQDIFGEMFILALTILSCLLSRKPCLRFILICFAQEIKGLCQSSFGNKIDFTNMCSLMFPQISWLKIKNSKNWDKVLLLEEQWLQQHQYLPVTAKPLYLFACERKDLKTRF